MFLISTTVIVDRISYIKLIMRTINIIQYAYALSNDCLYHISEVKPENKRTCECLSCETELIPRKGKNSDDYHHFYYKSKVTCSGETYLHKLGKKCFIEEYEYCIDNGKDFLLEYEATHVCSRSKRCKEKWYTFRVENTKDIQF